MRLPIANALWGLVLSAGAYAQPLPAPRVAEPDALAARFIDMTDRVAGYQVVMTKEQRIRSNLKPMETLLLKHRRNPECRYLKWIADPHQDREGIQCIDRYFGNLQIYEPDFPVIKTLSVHPQDPLARNGNLRPLTESGIYKLAEVLRIDRQRRAASPNAAGGLQYSERQNAGLDIQCRRSDRFYGFSTVDPYPVGTAEICFDRNTALPTEVQFWHLDGRLMEHYTYRDWQMVIPSDVDFDIANPAYRFKSR